MVEVSEKTVVLLCERQEVLSKDLNRYMKETEAYQKEESIAHEKINAQLRDMQKYVSNTPDPKHSIHHKYIDESIVNQHSQFVTALIAKEQAQREMVLNIKEKLISGGIWATVVATCSGLWYLLRHKLGA